MSIIIHFLWQTIWFTLSHTLNTFSMADSPNPIVEEVLPSLHQEHFLQTYPLKRKAICLTLTQNGYTSSKEHSQTEERKMGDMLNIGSDISLDRHYKTAYIGIKIFVNHSLMLISLKRVVMHYAQFCCCFQSFSLFRVSSLIIFEINGVSALLRASQC